MNKLYIGTYSHGVIIFDQKTGACKQLDERPRNK